MRSDSRQIRTTPEPTAPCGPALPPSRPGLAGLYRVYSWIVPLQPSSVHAWEVSRILHLETRAQASLAGSSDLYRLSGPDQALSDARSHGRVAAGRMVLLGGEVSALLLG